MNPVTVIGVTPVTPALPPMAAHMTLRDWFAGMAMMGFIDFGSLSDDEYFIKGATAAYKMADAMMADREKTK
jgi:hypothetical protein